MNGELTFMSFDSSVMQMHTMTMYIFIQCTIWLQQYQAFMFKLWFFLFFLVFQWIIFNKKILHTEALSWIDSFAFKFRKNDRKRKIRNPLFKLTYFRSFEMHFLSKQYGIVLRGRRRLHYVFSDGTN